MKRSRNYKQNYEKPLFFGTALAFRKRKSGKRVGILCNNRERETGTCRMTPALSLQRKITDNPVWKCVCKTTISSGKILAIIKDATSECSSTARLAGRGWTCITRDQRGDKEIPSKWYNWLRRKANHALFAGKGNQVEASGKPKWPSDGLIA